MAILIATAGRMVSVSGAFMLGQEDKRLPIKLVAIGNIIMMASMCFRGM